MGFWADNFGGGNSFTESLANAFTPNDGASYVGGTLTYDSGENEGQPYPLTLLVATDRMMMAVPFIQVLQTVITLMHL